MLTSRSSPRCRTTVPRPRVIDRRGLVVDVGAARRRAPLPAVLADLARAVEVVEVHEPLGQRVKVGRDRLRELGDARVAVAALDVAEDLIVGAVLLDDVDHVPDALVQRRASARSSAAVAAARSRCSGRHARSARASSRRAGAGSVRKPALSSCQTYCFSTVLQRGRAVGARCCSPTCRVHCRGSGPALLLPFTTYSRLPSRLTLTEFGYQPVGIRPATAAVALGRRATAITASELLPPLVT